MSFVTKGTGTKAVQIAVAPWGKKSPRSTKEHVLVEKPISKRRAKTQGRKSRVLKLAHWGVTLGQGIRQPAVTI